MTTSSFSLSFSYSSPLFYIISNRPRDFLSQTFVLLPSTFIFSSFRVSRRLRYCRYFLLFSFFLLLLFLLLPLSLYPSLPSFLLPPFFSFPTITIPRSTKIVSPSHKSTRDNVFVELVVPSPTSRRSRNRCFA